jgi:hypothetical protein
MPAIPKYSELQTLSDAQLIASYDRAAENTVVGTSFFLDELVRRANQREVERVRELTGQMRNMTIAIVVLTVVNVILVGATLLP